MKFDLKGLAASGGCFDFVAKKIDSFDYTIVSKKGNCPWKALIWAAFDPKKDLVDQRFAKSCSSGTCMNQQRITSIDWIDQEFEFDLCWNAKGSIGINTKCRKDQGLCHVKFKVTAKGSVDGWMGECKDCDKDKEEKK